MSVAIVSFSRAPVPPVLGGAVSQMIHQAAVAIRRPSIAVVSRWHPALEDTVLDPPDAYRFVDVPAVASALRPACPNLDAHDLRRFAYLSGVTDILERLDPGIIEVHSDATALAYLMRRFDDRSFLFYAHSAETETELPTGAAASRLDACVFVSKYLRDVFSSRNPAASADLHVIHNGVDTGRWHPRLRGGREAKRWHRAIGLTNGGNVLFLGRIVPQKGLRQLLDAWSVVRRAAGRARLVVVGAPNHGIQEDSDFYRSIRARACDSVHFTGYVPSQAIPDLMAAVDLVVVPSQPGEGLSNVALEAQAAGIPVVANRVGGLPEAVEDGETGLLVDDPEDAAALAGTLIRLLRNADERKRMGKAARKRAVGTFTIEQRVGRLRDVYRQLAHRLE